MLKNKGLNAPSFQRVSRLFLGAICVGALSVPLHNLPAQACGGFFCSLQQPVDQAAERILFVKDGGDMVAHVQIQYTGPSEEFSWVVPVPTAPKLSVGSDRVFQLLRNSTQPQFRLNITRTDGSCRQDQAFLDGANVPLSAPTAARAESADAGGVEVISQESVGPYDSAVIQGEDPTAIKSWLRENGYDIPDNVDPLLNPYIEANMPLLALKLRKDRGDGDLQPIVMRYQSEKPMIPIQLTAVAATDDMDVQVWILGEERAIPNNYPHVKINEARLNWLQGGNNYRSVVTEAMNEAGGRGFVTDYAGDSSIFPVEQIDPERFNLSQLRNTKDPLEFAAQVRGFFPNNDGYVGFLSRHLPKPQSLQSIDDATFYNQLEAYAPILREQEVTVNTSAALQELEETLVEPEREAQRLFRTHPYLTRMYTTLSPQEMTEDPVFEFKTQMEKVDVLRQAEGVRKCNPEVYEWEAPVEITTPSGLKFLANPQPRGIPVEPNNGNGSGEVSILPAAAQIQRFSATAETETLTDNVASIRASLNQPQQAVTPDGNGGVSLQPVKTGSGCACHGPTQPDQTVAESIREGSGETLSYALMLLGFLGWRRRRRKK